MLEQHQCSFEDAVFIGNDVNDAECLINVGLPIIVADSHPDINHLAIYTTKKNGGRGAVREVCDLITKYYKNKA